MANISDDLFTAVCKYVMGSIDDGKLVLDVVLPKGYCLTMQHDAWPRFQGTIYAQFLPALPRTTLARFRQHMEVSRFWQSNYYSRCIWNQSSLLGNLQ